MRATNFMRRTLVRVTSPLRRPTSADVATRAGVSRATVSMVLNNRIKGTVAEPTRQRVLEAANELGYTRSAVALSLKQQRTHTIGLITDEIATSPWAGRMVRAASGLAALRGYMVITVDLSLRDTRISDAVRLLSERQVDGFIYATMGRMRVPVPKVPAGMPLVMLNCDPDPGGPEEQQPRAFLPDDRGGARRAARRLLEVGHRRIVMLSGGDGSEADREREAGFRAELEADGLEPKVIRTGWQMNDGYRETARLLGEDEPPTAVFCIRDRVAAGAMHAAGMAGVDVPRELSVIGFDDEDFFAETLTPPLTTIALPHEQMGEWAITALLQQIDPEAGAATDAPEGHRVFSTCPLIERTTVAIAPEPEADSRALHLTP